MSEEKRRRSDTKMVPYPSQAIVPERDIGKQPVLETRHLGIEFGGLKAVEDFNMIIGRTEIAGLIGPNGAGKTTVFNLLTKVYEPTTGTVLINGRDTKGLSIVQTAHLGVARTFQNIRLFSQMTVEENVRIGLHNQIRYDMFTGILRLPRYWTQERKQHEETLRQRAHKEAKFVADAEAVAAQLAAQAPKVAVKVSESGKIYGSVTAAQLAEALAQVGINVDKKDITINAPEVKELGTYEAIVKLYKGIKGTFNFEVVSE